MTTELIKLINGVSGPIATRGVRDKIESMEAELKKLPQVEIPVVHRYSGGIYSREITIPRDTLLTGRIYKDDHFDVMVYGDVTVSGEDGKKRLQGFNIFPGVRGKKRAGYTHEETRWITFCVCDEMADDDYIDHLTTESFAEHEATAYIEESEIDKAFRSQHSYRETEYNAFRNGYLMASGKPSKTEADRADYNKTLKEFGFTEDVARAQSENESDMLDIDTIGLKVSPSVIEGVGLFATKKFSKGDVILPARIKGKRTIAGRYVNHAVNPNAIMMIDGDSINLVALKDIEGEEITTDYRDSLSLQVKRVS